MAPLLAACCVTYATSNKKKGKKNKEKDAEKGREKPNAAKTYTHAQARTTKKNKAAGTKGEH